MPQVLCRGAAHDSAIFAIEDFDPIIAHQEKEPDEDSGDLD